MVIPFVLILMVKAIAPGYGNSIRKEQGGFCSCSISNYFVLVYRREYQISSSEDDCNGCCGV